MTPDTTGSVEPTHRIDRVTLATSLGLLLLVCLPLALAPESGGRLIDQIYRLIAERFGVAYQWATLGMTGLLAWLAFGRYGRIRLGSGPPEFSTFSWMAMLFCAGTGAGLLFWATIEWTSYIDSPPFGVSPGSAEAMEWATTYGIFHWGISAWCIYCFPAVAIAVPYYTRNLDYLRLSTGLHALLGRRGPDGLGGRATDLIFILALVGGTGTSLGLSTPMIAACVSEITGIEHSFRLDVAITLLASLLFALSVYLGLERGIKRLSDLNAAVALLFLGFVLFAGPTLFILKTGTNSLGLMLQNFVRLNTWTDPIAATGFVEDWTVFYWAWWMAYGPYIGLFVTRISRGRSLRQLIVSMTLLGTLGCALFYIVLGNYTLSLETGGRLAVRAVAANDGAAAAIAQSLATLPAPALALGVFALVAIISVATTYDSASYSIAAAGTRSLRIGHHPDRWYRVLWAMTLSVLPITLIFLGGLRTIQSAVLVVSLPLLVVAVLMAISLLRTLRSLHTDAAGPADSPSSPRGAPEAPEEPVEGDR